MKKIAPYAKAVTGAVVAGLTALVTALDDETITNQELAIIAVAFFVALGAVWAIPNAEPVSGNDDLD